MPLALVPVAVAVAVGALVFRSEVAPSQAGSSANKGAPLSAVVLQHGQDTGGSTSGSSSGRRGSAQGSTSSGSGSGSAAPAGDETTPTELVSKDDSTRQGFSNSKHGASGPQGPSGEEGPPA